VDLAAISSWHRRWLADGIRLVSSQTAGEWVHIRTNQRPLRPFSRVLGDAVYGELEKFTTVEGEYAGLVISAEPGGVRVIAMVVGDDSYVTIEGHSPDPLRSAWFRDLVHTLARFYPLGLGHPRRRRFLYRPPAGWEAVRRTGAVLWLNSEYPKVAGRITVFDARPLKWFAPGAVDRFLYIDENPFAHVDPPRAPVAVMVRAGFGGTATGISGRAADGTPLAMAKTLLQDQQYFYAVQLDGRVSEWDSLIPVYEELVRTIEPLPSGEVERPAQQLIHWIE
jgi:hypothetical protein